MSPFRLSGRPDQGHDGLCLDLLHTIFSAQFRSFTMKHAYRSKGGRRPCPLEFILFKAHISFEFGGVPMPLTGAIPEGPSFFCPHCGALYAVTYSRLSSSDSNVARCVVCGQIMDKWDSTKVPSFKLIHRPDDY
jgi:predicted Zn finger-like uncharacterized protein